MFVNYGKNIHCHSFLFSRGGKLGRQRGISLIELIMFILIISIAVAGILLVMNRVSGQSADTLMRKQALAIAESVLEEVELQDFGTPAGGFAGPFTLANRASFDTVTNYAGFNTNGIYSPSTGAAIANLAAYSLVVTVANSALGTIPAASSMLITVTVTDPIGNRVQLSGYRTNY
jgi:MSHA pilin protein MshD